MPGAIHNRALLSVCCLLASLSAAAQSDKPFAAPQATAHTVVSGGGGLAQVTLSLVLVLAAVFAAAWLVRRARALGKPASQAITVLAQVGLGPKERAVLIQVGSKQLLLGVAPGRVSTLHVLDEPVSECPAQRVGSEAGSAAGAPVAAEFKAILKRSLGLK